MLHAAQRISEINESETLAMTKLARELKEAGKDVISLSIGEPDFNTPEHIGAAAIRAIEEGYTHYTPVLGFQDFREAICRKLQRENGLSYQASEIIVSTGAKHTLVNIMLSVLNPGDEVIIPAPYWVSYPSMVRYAGGVPVFLNTSVSNDYKPTPEQLRAAITPKTKIFLFSSPCNPSGTVFQPADLEAYAAVLREFPDILVVSDEIYEHIIFEGSHLSIASLPGFRERTAVVNGLSKGYAMTGWRIGYMAGPQWLVKACEKLQGVFTSGANSIAQKAGIAALDGTMEPTWQMREVFRSRRNLVLGELAKIQGLKLNVPEGAFYVFPDVSHFLGKSYQGKQIPDSVALAIYLLNEALVATVAGDAFGMPECIRLSYATDEASLVKACSRMKEALEKLS
ncbi:MAG: pyridoxal phosphate-dependent aminotransferase [Bacteroidetes bacterium]|nr:pyridoxal phosphate-dependent aminotransferase [Bacteroidota bacterium]